MPYIPSKKLTSKRKYETKTLEGLAEFAQAKGFTKEAEKAVAKPKLSMLQRLGRGLSSFEIGNSLYQQRYEGASFLETYGKDVAKGLGSLATGKDYRQEPKKTFKDIMVKEGAKDRPGKLDAVDVAGLAGDIVFDPSTWIPAGLLAKGSARVAKAAGQVIKKTPVIGKTAERAGEGLGKMFKPFYEQKKLGKVTIPEKIGKDGTKIAARTIEKTGEEYISMIQKYYKGTRAEMDEFMTQLSDRAKGLKKQIGKKQYEKGKVRIGEAIETGTKTGDEFLDEILDTLVADQTKLAKQLKEKGILQSEIPDYMHHMLTPEARNFMGAGGDLTAFLKPLRAKLSAGKERGILKLTDETGKEIISNWKKLGLKRINYNKVRDSIESSVAKKTDRIQKAIDSLAKEDVAEATKHLRGIVQDAKAHVSKAPSITGDVISDVSKADIQPIIDGLIREETENLFQKLSKVEREIAESQGKEFLKPGASLKTSKEAKIKGLQDEMIKLQNDLAEKISNIEQFAFIGKNGKMFKQSTATVKEINEAFMKQHGEKLFEEDAFKAFAKSGVDSIKALRTHDFLQRVGTQFGMKPLKEGMTKHVDEAGVKWVESSAPQLKGQLIPEALAKDVDNTYKVLSNDESTNEFIQFYDKMLAYWKGSVTGYFPAFHTRNLTGGIFNNFIAGLKNPLTYKAGTAVMRGKKGNIVLKGGQKMSYDEIRKLTKEYGIVGQSGYLDVSDFLKKDIDPSVAQRVAKAPQKLMGMTENGLRVPLFIDGLKKGMNPEQAAKRVIKYHFDYMPEGFSAFEKTVMKRLIPFYTFTRNNIPLQLEQLIAQPGKYAAVMKAQRAFGTKPSTEEEQVLPRWLKERFTMKAEGGYWSGVGIPLEEATEKLSAPLRGFGISMSPFVKIPMEQLTGYNIFKEKAIDEDSYAKYYRNAPQPIKDFLQLKKRTAKNGNEYWIANPRRKYWLEAIGSRGLSTAMRVANGVQEDESRLDLLNLITTIRRYDYDIEDLKRWSDTDARQQLEGELIRAGELAEYKSTYIPKDYSTE